MRQKGILLGLLIVAAIQIGCRAKQPSQPRSNGARRNVSLQPRLLLATTGGNPRGDEKSAEAMEHFGPGHSLASVIQLETKGFKHHGWVPLVKNVARWKANPPDRPILGYHKDGLYYLMYIRSTSSREVTVTHALTRTPFDDYFLPIAGEATGSTGAPKPGAR